MLTFKIAKLFDGSSEFALDVLECPRCHNRLRILAAIHSPEATQKILECLGLPSRAPPVAPAVREFTRQSEAF